MQQHTRGIGSVWTRITIYIILAIALIAVASLKSMRTSSGANPRSSVVVRGIIRDFSMSDANFALAPSGGNGHYAGNVATTLGSDGRPDFIGGVGGPIDDFSISGTALKPKETYAVMISVLGAAINSGSYDRPVTMRVTIGNETIDPFGSYDLAIAGNVNRAGNPRKYVHNTLYPADTPIHVTGRSWAKKQASYTGTSESHWQTHNAFSTSTSTPQIMILRNGDNVPNLGSFMGQLAAKEFVVEFVNQSTQKMVLNENQVIYLFELGTTTLTAAAADFQDLVVLVTLGDTTDYLNTLDAEGDSTTTLAATGYRVNSQWRDSAGNPIAPHLFNASAGDTTGTKGAAGDGGIGSASTFEQWFSDTLGVNVSGNHSFTLIEDSKGVFEYTNDNFFPIDDLLQGNEDEKHNTHFTYTLSVEFVHHAGEHRFFEFNGGDDVWVFVDDQLAIDVGGIQPNTRQYADVDRLGLTDGETYWLHLFYAQRYSSASQFNIRTNLDLTGAAASASVMSAFD